MAAADIDLENASSVPAAKDHTRFLSGCSNTCRAGGGGGVEHDGLRYWERDRIGRDLLRSASRARTSYVGADYGTSCKS